MIKNMQMTEINSISYAAAFEKLIFKHKELSDAMNSAWSHFFYPAMSIASFSIELALKGILDEQNKICMNKVSTRGHDIEILFNRITKENQEKICKKTIRFYNYHSEMLNSKFRLNDDVFLQELKHNNRVFEELRYFHEEKARKNFDYDFITSFVFALNYTQEAFESFIEKLIDKSDKQNEEIDLYSKLVLIILYHRRNGEKGSKEDFLLESGLVLNELKKLDDWSVLNLTRLTLLLHESKDYTIEGVENAIRIIDSNIDIESDTEFIRELKDYD